ncbi:hypothetical protein THIOKS11100011 [Thiocapsa sp. KS1]|nr:hypothetical protein THIOKS11100011 [Thiocapsa sp. KS1]
MLSSPTSIIVHYHALLCIGVLYNISREKSDPLGLSNSNSHIFPAKRRAHDSKRLAAENLNPS